MCAPSPVDYMTGVAIAICNTAAMAALSVGLCLLPWRALEPEGISGSEERGFVARDSAVGRRECGQILA